VLDVGQPDGRAHCWLDLTEGHMNRHHVVHGGICGVLLDSAMGTTGSLTVDATGRAPFLTVSLTTQFLASARVGQRITATGQVTGGGRSLLFIAGELVAEDGSLIATATGVFKRVPQDRLSPEAPA
jgi:uncharacterized protein (TIGR00369 family)